MNWDYHWSIGPAPVLASGTGTVSLALGWDGAGANKLLAAAVTTSSVAANSNPDVYHNNFNLTLHLTDPASHQSGQLTFQGLINGTVSANNANLELTITKPVQGLLLGGHMFWVSLPSELDLLRPGAGKVPTMYANVQTWNVAPPANPQVQSAVLTALPMASLAASTNGATNSPSTPEPSTLVLAALGISLLGFGGVRRPRRPNRRVV
jgi:hypothetical protein